MDNRSSCIGAIVRGIIVVALVIGVIYGAARGYNWIFGNDTQYVSGDTISLDEDGIAFDLGVLKIEAGELHVQDGDGDQFICNIERLWSNPAYACRHPSVLADEQMIDHNPLAILGNLDGKDIWTWHATNYHTWIAVGDIPGVYKCPSDVIGDLDNMLSSCIRIEDNLNTGGATLGSVYGG